MSADDAARPDVDPWMDEAPFAPLPSRFRSRRAALGKLVEGKAEILVTRPAGKARSFSLGQRVFHDKFGYGSIDAIEGNKLDISFEKAGRKKVIDSFVEPA